MGVNYIRQCAELTEVRAQDKAWWDVPIIVARSALRRLHHAFEAFFRRVKSNDAPGFPRFRSRDRYDSFGIGRATIVLDHVTVPKLGSVRFKLYRPIRGEVRDVSIVKTARRWMLCVVCDLGDAAPKQPVRSAVGIDVGLEVFATLSNGSRIENPRFLRLSEGTLSRRQRVLARKRRGSASRRVAKRLVASTHEHIRNQRLDFARKLVCALFSQFDFVAYEDLGIARMVRGGLAKSINDAAWGTFLRCLTLKAEEAGRWAVPVDPRGTSQRCSGCGRTVVKALSDREHRCNNCGLVVHRDENAALNVLALGLSAEQLTKALKEVKPSDPSRSTMERRKGPARITPGRSA